MKKFIYLLLCGSVALSSCNNTKKTADSENPFFSDYKTAFETPDFSKIHNSHYMPAFKQAMKEHNEEINKIIENNEEPSFENTILAYDKSGKLLSKVSRVFYTLKSAHSNDSIKAIAKEITPISTKHWNNISLNPKLFNRIKMVYDKRNELKLDAQQVRLVEKYYKDFERSGANLPADKKEKLKKLNEERAMVSLQLGDNLLKETNDFKMILSKKEELAGLPKSVIDAAAETAKSLNMDGKWVFTTQKPSMIPFLQFSENRELRKKLYSGYFMRGNNNNENDNKKLFQKLVNLRIEKAKLMGYNTYAEYIIEKNMAKTPENVMKFLNNLWESALPVAKKEAKEMQNMINKEGGKFKLASWDWWYYAEKLRKAKYDLDENELKPYFKLSNVRDGMFYVANKLYGISFEKRNDISVYHKDVETFEVKDKDGSHLGILYLDYHPRASKRGGAWCGRLRSTAFENGKHVAPLVTITCNFTKPTKDTPSLLTFDETTTLFHEFGHALHGLFTRGKYSRTAGSVPRDYVELPSQIMENWAAQPEILKVYAKHYKTGEVIPQELINKLEKSSKFNQGFATVEYLAASLLDMTYHSLTNKLDKDVVKFEKETMDKYGLINEIWPRYRTTYFNHIFGEGYVAGYYVYIWAGVLDADAFNAFKESGDLFNPELAAKFRKHCLSECGDDEGMVQYKKFRGQEPSIDPLLKRRGLK
ncbi:MAG: M3 family metallopeptidase [Marinifilaceae bacterium]|jgi:peptidyl-dipeptidase Dcp|nr:M3 family metallopeptidase [Marinifilaceae bacterium]